MPIFLDVLPRLGLREAEAVVAQAKSLFAGAGKDIGASFGEGPAAAMKRMQEEYGRTAGVATETSRAILRANTEVEASTKALSAATATYGAQAAQTASAERALTEARIASLGATRTHNAAMNDAVAAQTAMTRSTNDHAGAVAAAGRVLNTVGIASVVGFTAVVGESAKQAADFQQKMIKLTASAGETSSNLKIVSDGIMALASQTGNSAGQLADAMYLVEKAGYQGADGIKVLTGAAQLANAEGADLTQVINGLTTTMHDFHLPLDQTNTIASKLNVAVGNSKTPLQDFTGALHQAEPVAANAKIAYADLWAVMSQGIASGAGPEQVAENTRNAINSLAGAQGPARDAMAQFGISADDISQRLGDGPGGRGLAGTMQYLSDTIMAKLIGPNKISTGEFKQNAQAASNLTDMMGQMSPAAAKIAEAFHNGTSTRKEFTAAVKGSSAEDAAQLQQFGALQLKLDGFSTRMKNGQSIVETYNQAMKDITGTVAGQSIAVQNTGDNAARTNQLIAEINGTTAAADGTVKGFNETQGTLAAKLRDAKAGFGDAAIQLGNVFIPVLTDVASGLKTVAQFLAEHKGLAEGVTYAIGGIAGAWIFAKGIMVFDTILTGIEKMVAGFGNVKTAVLGSNDAMLATKAAAAEGAAAVEAAGYTLGVSGAGQGSARN